MRALIKYLGLALTTVFVLSCSQQPQSAVVSDRIVYFKKLAADGEPIIAAIGDFEKDNGHPPATLDELVPKYLASAPDTNRKHYPHYEYLVFPEGGLGHVIWYDLGRSDPAFPQTELYFQSFGDPERALLVFSLNGPHVISAMILRADPKPIRPFVAENWRGGSKDVRREMAADFAKNRFYRPITTDTLQTMLGEPDGKGVLIETPWELRVVAGWANGEVDDIFYRPTKSYPLDERKFIPIGDWRYWPSSAR